MYGYKQNYILFSHSVFDGHLGCFYLLVLVDYAAMNMAVQRLSESLLSPLLGRSAEVGLLDRTAIL